MRQKFARRSEPQLPLHRAISKSNRRMNPRLRTKHSIIHSILAPVDFSDCSLAGLNYAVKLARKIAARVIVLHVVDLGPVMMSLGNYGSPEHAKAARRRTHDSMRNFIRRVDFNGVPVVTVAVAGYCPSAIYEIAEKEGADLIVMSTHGRTGLRHAVMGSVAEGTIRHARLPVLVVPSVNSNPIFKAAPAVSGRRHNATQSTKEEPCQPRF